MVVLFTEVFLMHCSSLFVFPSVKMTPAELPRWYATVYQSTLTTIWDDPGWIALLGHTVWLHMHAAARHLLGGAPGRQDMPGPWGVMGDAGVGWKLPSPQP